jgi:hypothetical protein
MPATVAAGDLLLILFACMGGNPTVTTPSGWVLLQNSASEPFIHSTLFAKTADGSEGGTTVNVVTSLSKTAAVHVLRISGWGGFLSSTIAAASAGTNPDPPSVSTPWGTSDNLWIAITANGDDDQAVTGFPTSYSSGAYTLSGGGTNNGPVIASAYRNNATVTENPGTFTIASSESFFASTIGIKPGPLPTAAADYPSENDVRDGVTFNSGASEGNLVLPAEEDVESGVQYGTAGTEFTGTLTAGGGGGRQLVDGGLVA